MRKSYLKVQGSWRAMDPDAYHAAEEAMALAEDGHMLIIMSIEDWLRLSGGDLDDDEEED